MNKHLERAIKRHPWLEITGEESQESLAQKTKWQMVYSLPDNARQVWWQGQNVKLAENSLEGSIQLNKKYEELARDNPEHAKLYRSVKPTLREIRKERERVQWERKRLNKMKQELKSSSESVDSKS